MCTTKPYFILSQDQIMTLCDSNIPISSIMLTCWPTKLLKNNEILSIFISGHGIDKEIELIS